MNKEFKQLYLADMERYKIQGWGGKSPYKRELYKKISLFSS